MGHIVEGDHVRELVVLLHQVQLLNHGRVVLEAILANLETENVILLNPKN